MDWMSTPEGRDFIKEMARGTVVAVAPEEMDLFEEMTEEYFADPAPPTPGSGASDDALGFGLDAALVAVTPAAAAMASAVVGFLLNEVLDLTADRAVEGVLRRVFNREKTPDTPQLNMNQLARVKALAIQQAVAHGLNEAEAERMASTMVGSLISGV